MKVKKLRKAFLFAILGNSQTYADGILQNNKAWNECIIYI